MQTRERNISNLVGSNLPGLTVHRPAYTQPDLTSSGGAKQAPSFLARLIQKLFYKGEQPTLTTSSTRGHGSLDSDMHYSSTELRRLKREALLLIDSTKALSIDELLDLRVRIDSFSFSELEQIVATIQRREILATQRLRNLPQ